MIAPMKAARRWWKAPARTLVTVCWMEQGISLARWDPRVGRQRVCRGAATLAAEACDPAGYRGALTALAGPLPLKRLTVRWIVPREAFPACQYGEGGQPACDPVRLPQWIERCWYQLPSALLPAGVVSGLEAMQAELLDWPEFAVPGTGFHAVIGGRSVFIGHGNGRSFRRFSRGPAAAAAVADALPMEWLLQTRLLFKNRTGMELKRILVPEGRQYSFSAAGPAPFEVIPGARPGAWSPREGLDLEPALLFLHASAVLDKAVRAAGLAFPELERRRRLRMWEGRLRLASCFLLCGWVLLLLGACRHETGPAVPPGARHAWDAEKHHLSLLGERWRSLRQHESRQHAPFQLIGAIAGSQPAGVQLSRFHLERGSAANRGQLAVHLEGVFHGERPSGVFREWMEQLKVISPLEQVDNLHFRRDGGRILFSLEGTANGEGGHR
jgi:hypothetical protein